MEMFNNILEASRDVFRHLANARIEGILLVAGAIVLLSYFLFRNK